MKPETAKQPPLNIVDLFAAKEAERRHGQPGRYMNDRLATVYVAMTAIILSFAALVEVLPILFLYALWFTQPLQKGRSLLRLTLPCVWLLTLPLLDVLSTMWSDYPVKSLYLGTETLSMMGVIIIMTRVVRFRAFADGLTIGISIALIITLASRIYGTDFISGTYSLIGYFRSKNTVGLLAEIGMVSSVVTLFMQGKWPRKILLSLLPLALCTLCLEQSKSATSALSAIAAFAVMAWMIALVHLPPTLKRAAFLCTVLLVFVGGTVGFAMKGGDLVLSAFGKDSTLTGRTYLWHEGFKIGAERPILGHGYSAFWVQGQAQAERYWYEFQMFTRSGFHFHNIYIQAFVDLGGVGVALVLLQILIVCYLGLRIGLAGISGEAVFWTGLCFMFLVRSFAEVDFLAAYTFGTLLIGSALLRLTQWKHKLQKA